MKARLLRSSARQLVSARPGKPVEIAGSTGPIRGVRSILIPIDFSESSIHGLAYAVAFAKQFGSKICLFSVINDVPTSFEFGHPDYDALIESRRRACQRRLEEVLKDRVPAEL